MINERKPASATCKRTDGNPLSSNTSRSDCTDALVGQFGNSIYPASGSILSTFVLRKSIPKIPEMSTSTDLRIAERSAPPMSPFPPPVSIGAFCPTIIAGDRNKEILCMLTAPDAISSFCTFPRSCENLTLSNIVAVAPVSIQNISCLLKTVTGTKNGLDRSIGNRSRSLFKRGPESSFATKTTEHKTTAKASTASKRTLK